MQRQNDKKGIPMKKETQEKPSIMPIILNNTNVQIGKGIKDSKPYIESVEQTTARLSQGKR